MTEIIPLEPNRVKLIWQSGGTDRTKYVVGELVRAGEQVSLSYFWYEDDFMKAATAGFSGHPAFPYTTPVHHSNVLEVFSRRLPSRHRSDFQAYLLKNRLRPLHGISDFALLGYTSAYLPSDGFSFAIDWRYQEVPFIFMMQVSGFRYYKGMEIEISSLLRQPVTFQPEPSNAHDKNAIRIMLGPIHIGYVPRYYAAEVGQWIKHGWISALIERIDGAMARPEVHLILSVAYNLKNSLK